VERQLDPREGLPRHLWEVLEEEYHHLKKGKEEEGREEEGHRGQEVNGARLLFLIECDEIQSERVKRGKEEKRIEQGVHRRPECRLERLPSGGRSHLCSWKGSKLLQS
jgi:hypothetical protein